MPIYECVCISRDRENVPCFIAIDGRSVDLVRMFMCASSPSALKKKEKKRKRTSERDSCMHESTSSSYHQFINATRRTRLSKKSRATIDLMSNVLISRSNEMHSMYCACKKFHLLCTLSLASERYFSTRINGFMQTCSKKKKKIKRTQTIIILSVQRNDRHNGMRVRFVLISIKRVRKMRMTTQS